MNYGTVENNVMHPLPNAVRIGNTMVCNPQSADDLVGLIARLNVERERQGLPPYLPIVDTPPQTDDAHYSVPTGWTRDGDTWRRVYEVRPYPPPPPRRWTRLAIKTALAQAGMISQALAYLAQVEIATGYSAAEALQDCDYIEEGYPDATRWAALLDGAAQAIGKTREEIDMFLDGIPQEA